MKKAIFLLIILFSANVFAQSDFQKRYSGSRRGHCIKETPDHNLIIAGSKKLAATEMNPYFIKIDSEGNRLWSREVQGSGINYFFKCDVAGDGGYVAAGRSESFGLGSVAYVLKLDSSGSKLWEKAFYKNAKPVFGAGITSPDSNSFLFYGSRLFVYGYNPFIIKLDNAGNILWQKGLLIDSNISYYPIELVMSNGDMILMGSNYLIKLDTIGNVIWQKKYTGSFDMTDIVVAPSGDYVISCERNDTSGISTSFIICLDTSGNIKWNRIYAASPGWLGGMPVLCNSPNNGFYITGEFVPDTVSSALSYYFFIEIDSIGNLILARYFYVDINENIPRDILVSSDQSGFIIGSPAFAPSLDIIKFKFPSTLPCSEPLTLTSGTDSITTTTFPLTFYYDMQDTAVSLPLLIDFPNPVANCLNTGAASQEINASEISIYPNPATDQFVVEIPIAIGTELVENTTLEIFNLLGEKIYSIPYSEESTVDCGDFPRGIYIIRVCNSESQAIQKLIIE